MTNLIDLVSQHGAASWDKQESLAALIGESEWQLRLRTGQITFGGKHTFPVQVLGSESQQSRTWLWGWANTASGIAEPLLTASRQIRTFGAQNNIREFTDSELSLETIDGHLLSLIASGVCHADCYYKGPYEGGAVFLLLTAPQLKAHADDTALRFVRIFTTFISQFACDHRTALTAYAAYKGYKCETRGSRVTCISPQGEPVRVEFDGEGRVAEMTSELIGASASSPAKQPWWKLGK